MKKIAKYIGLFIFCATSMVTALAENSPAQKYNIQINNPYIYDLTTDQSKINPSLRYFNPQPPAVIQQNGKGNFTYNALSSAPGVYTGPFVIYMLKDPTDPNRGCKFMFTWDRDQNTCYAKATPNSGSKKGTTCSIISSNYVSGTPPICNIVFAVGSATGN